ncbi:hypothetical protein ACQCN2_15055 [Brevibacillus ginsengisoli]|uniref:hypothetical protein n=1 Tax=Brevibacillus ginsengisoli TaxID=363854 RepID=UPI003CEA86DF
MVKILFGLHLSFLFIWAVALVTTLIQSRQVSKNWNTPKTRSRLEMIVLLVRWVLNPSSFIVLVTGIFMIENMGLVHTQKPLYILLMEFGGAALIFGSIIFLTLQSLKIKKLVNQSLDVEQKTGAQLVSGLGLMTGGTVILALVVLLIAYTKVS